MTRTTGMGAKTLRSSDCLTPELEFPWPNRCQCAPCLDARNAYKNRLYRSRVEAFRAYHREWSKGESRTGRDRTAKEKSDQAARDIIHRALRSKRLTRPQECELCGATPGVDARGHSLIFVYIPDNQDPWQHEWLCSLCRGERRQRLRDQSNRDML